MHRSGGKSDQSNISPLTQDSDGNWIEIHTQMSNHEINGKEKQVSQPKKLKIPSGNPVSSTSGEAGPTLLQDYYLLEKLADLNRERSVERMIYAKAAGAYGHFTVTQDITTFTNAKIFSEVGKQTEVFGRFSILSSEKGSADTVRDVRGFALKFYTEEGNWDLVGSNTPIFFIRDPIKFPELLHTLKRDPQTNTHPASKQWEFWSRTPESLHQITILFSDRGIPLGIPYMNGYGSHTYSFMNDRDERFWVKFHFKTQQGIRCLSQDEADRLAGKDPDYHTRELLKTIQRGKFPKWTLYVQIMPEKEAKDYKWYPFDLTKVWPHAGFPLIEVGVLELNRNPENYFEQVEQAAFTPANVVPGISFSPEKMLQARLFAYTDAHRYRLGPNYKGLPINTPHFMKVDDENTAIPDSARKEPQTRIGNAADCNEQKWSVDDDSAQPGNLFRLMSSEQQSVLIDNIVRSLKDVPKTIQVKMVAHFHKADPEYGHGVAKGLGLK